MKNYLVIFTCDVGDADYIRNNYVLNESELEELKEEVLTVKKLRKSFMDSPIPEIYFFCSWKDNMVNYGSVRDVLTLHRSCDWINKIDPYLTEWKKTLSEKDINKFLSFNERLPIMDDEKVHTIESIEVYELVNPKPINLI